MINYKNTHITAVSKGIIAHGVNCEKVMNSGVSKTISDKYPKVKDKFMKTVPLLGQVDYVDINDNLIIANCYIQKYYSINGVYSSLLAVEQCLRKVFTLAKVKNYEVYMPKISLNSGDLKWSKLEYLINCLAYQYPVKVTICGIN